MMHLTVVMCFGSFWCAREHGSQVKTAWESVGWRGESFWSRMSWMYDVRRIMCGLLVHGTSLGGAYASWYW